MDETKKILRSILVSSPFTIDVIKLNRDFKEVAGYEIPYRDLGYKSLLDFLNAIPDVLRVNGNSMHSGVTLIVSEKTAHVNDMVLKQRNRKGGGVGGFFATKKNRGNQRYGAPPRTPLKTNYMVSSSGSSRFSNSYNQSDSHLAAPSCNSQNSNYAKSQHNSPKQNTSLSNQNNGVNSYKNESNKITPLFDLDLKLKESPVINSETENNEHRKESNQLLRRLNYKDNKLNDESQRIPSLFDIKIDMRDFNKLENVETKNEDKHLLRRLNYKEQHFSDSAPSIPGVGDVDHDSKNTIFNKDDLLNKDTSDFMRQLLLRKDSFKSPCEKNSLLINNSLPEVSNLEKVSLKIDISQKYILDSKIPRRIQDNLRDLIANLPEGIWCSQLPTEYRKIFRKELNYEDLGFRCLINMCMDLENIFHCSKESLCDFKLYDVRKPVPRVRILEDHYLNLSDNSRSFAGLLEDDSTLKLDWSTYAHLLPEGAVELGVEIPRDFVSLSTKKGDLYLMVAAEIYDPSKFWVYKDDGELDALMDQMQQFYEENNQRYKVPESLLETGLYCVVVTLKEFHRAVIVKIQRDVNFVNVFFIDYGSLGKAPKTEVWFLTKDFVRLPAQAIRARLAGIYPPVEYATWSTEATRTFRSLASMKHVEAKVAKIVPDKKIIEVYLENPTLAPGTDINSILVQDGHALYTSQPRTIKIEDPHCIPRVKFVHLFPEFEEIEYWLTPSIEEIARFADTDLTADFFFPQYFTRPINSNLHNKIEAKAKKLIKRKEKPVKYMEATCLERMRDMQEILKIQYGHLYEQNKEKLNESVEECKKRYFINKKDDKELDDRELEEQGEDSDCGDYENLLNKLRSQRLNSKVVGNKSGDTICKSKFNYLNVKKKKVDNENVTMNFYKCFTEEPAICSPAKNDTYGVEKYLSQLGKWNDLSELEKYLSEDEEPSPSSTNNGKLIDIDDVFHSTCRSRNSPKNTSFDSLLNQSISSVKGQRRRNRFSLISDSSSSDLDEPSVGHRYRHTPDYKGSSVCSDLIQLDVVLDCPKLTPQIVGKSGAPSKTKFLGNSAENLSDADDEDDSDSRLNPNAEIFILKSPKSKSPRRSPDDSVQVNECAQTDSVSLYSSSSSSDPIESNVSHGNPNGLCTITSMSLDDTSDLTVSATAFGQTDNSSVSPITRDSSAMSHIDAPISSDVPKHSREVNSPANLAVAVKPPPGLGPPPGFGPVPRYSCQSNGMPLPDYRYTVYQPWSTVDCMGNGAHMNFQRPQSNMTMPTNGLGFTPQQFVAQVSSMYRCPPIVVFNYNGLPPVPPNPLNYNGLPPVSPNPYNESLAQYNCGTNSVNNFFSNNSDHTPN